MTQYEQYVALHGFGAGCSLRFITKVAALCSQLCQRQHTDAVVISELRRKERTVTEGRERGILSLIVYVNGFNELVSVTQPEL
jgi:hypothetical protein